jgi:hypothetical protein
MGRRKITFAAALVAVFGMWGQSATATPDGDAQRPFKSGLLSGPASPTLEQRCGDDLSLALTLTGTATHVGRFSAMGTHCTEWGLLESAVPFYSGIATFTAADGSTLEVHYEGWQDAPEGFRATLAVTVDVVGGTGRFADAAGSWTGAGSIDFTTFTVETTLSGWVSY